MQTEIQYQYDYEFRFVELDTDVLVEESEEGVLIRATRDSFSSSRKWCFVRQLAAEGFIDGAYERFGSFKAMSNAGVRWCVDPTWRQPRTGSGKRADHFMLQLVGWSCIVWLGLLITILLA